MTQTDLSYTTGDMWTKFYPNTEAGELAYRKMMDENGVAAVLNIHAKNVIAQIKKAGYSVAKSKPVSLDTIFSEFDELFGV